MYFYFVYFFSWFIFQKYQLTIFYISIFWITHINFPQLFFSTLCDLFAFFSLFQIYFYLIDLILISICFINLGFNYLIILVWFSKYILILYFFLLFLSLFLFCFILLPFHLTLFTFFFFVFLPFLGLLLQHMEVHRLGVESELQSLAYTTATATRDLSRVCKLHHSLWQRRILNPLSKARDWTHKLMVPSWIR